MKISQYLEKYGNDEKKVYNLQKLYDNWMKTGSVLYNAMSDIVSMCGDHGSDVFAKIETIKNAALDSMERADNIGLTNPDFYEYKQRSNNLAKQIKLMKRREGKC